MFSMSTICERKEKGITQNKWHIYHLGSVPFFPHMAQFPKQNTHQEK